jgi:hypothetical protein
MADGTCSSCGKALATADILYNDRGDVVCSDCAAKADIKGDEGRAANNIKIAAITCLAGAIFAGSAFFVGFGLGFFSAGVISVAAGFFALNGLAGPGAEKFVAYLSPAAKSTAWVCVSLGVAIDIFVTMCWGDVIHIRPMYLG